MAQPIWVILGLHTLDPPLGPHQNQQNFFSAHACMGGCVKNSPQGSQNLFGVEYFRELVAPAKFQNPTTTPSWILCRKLERREKKEK
jgi:hypothetical protein